MGYNGLFLPVPINTMIMTFGNFPGSHLLSTVLTVSSLTPNGLACRLWVKAATRLITQPWSAVAWKADTPAERAVGFFGNRHALALILKRLNDG
jgi:hypothetical protein